MNKRITYQNDAGGVAVIILAPNSGMTDYSQYKLWDRELISKEGH